MNIKVLKKQKITNSVLESSSIWVSVIKMSIPTMLGLLSVSLMQLTDTLMASSNSSDAAIISSGIGFAISIISIVIAIVTIVSSGASIRFTFLLGEGKEESAKYTAGSGITTGLILTASIMILLSTIVKPLITMQSGLSSDELINYGTTYLYLFIAWLPLYVIYNDLSTYLRIEGNYKVTISIVVISVFVNIFLNYGLLQTNLDSVLAVAISTLITHALKIVVLMIAFYFFRKQNRTILFEKLKYYKPNLNILSLSLLLGLPMFVRTTLLSADNIIIASQMSSVVSPPGESSTYYQETVGVYNQTYSIIFNVMTGLMNGAGTVIAYNFGKKNFDKTKKAVTSLASYQILITSFLVLLCVIFSSQLFDMFGVSADSNSIYIFRVLISRMFFMSLSIVAFTFLINTYQVARSYFHSLVSGFIFFIPISYLMFSLLDINVAIWSYLIVEFISLLFSLILISDSYFNFKELYLRNELHITRIQRFISQQRYAMFDKKHYKSMEKTKRSLSVAINTNDVDKKLAQTLRAANEINNASKIIQMQLKNLNEYNKHLDKKQKEEIDRANKKIKKIDKREKQIGIQADKAIKSLIKRNKYKEKKSILKKQRIEKKESRKHLKNNVLPNEKKSLRNRILIEREKKKYLKKVNEKEKSRLSNIKHERDKQIKKQK